MNVFFAVLHVTNPNITWRTLFSLFICGVTFTLPRSRISGLWMSTGLHTAWNFTIGNVFGDSVSGVKFKSSILRVHYRKPKAFPSALLTSSRWNYPRRAIRTWIFAAFHSYGTFCLHGAYECVLTTNCQIRKVTVSPVISGHHNRVWGYM